MYPSVDRQQRWQSPRARILSGSLQAIADIDVKKSRQVQIQGRARGRGILFCPITNQPVIGYRIRIQSLSLETSNWETVVEITRIKQFEVYDESGSAFIHWLGPLLLAQSRPAVELGEALSGPKFYEMVDTNIDEAKELLRINPEDGKYLLRSLLSESNHVRYWATRIEHNSDVFVCGRPVVRLNPNGESAGYREAPNPLVIRSTGGHPLLLADCAKDELVRTLDDRLVD